MPTELEQIKSMIEKQTSLLSVHMEVSQRRHDETQKCVRDLSVSLMGDQRMGVKGVVKRTEANEEYIEKDKLLKSNLRGRVWAIVIIGTSVMTFITSWLFWMVTH